MHERLTAQQDDVIPETSGIHALLVSLLGALAANTWAQGYPAKPVRYIMPTTGASEVVGRLIAQDLSPMIVVVHPSFPAKSIGDLVRLARAKPGAINYSSAGVGTSTFLAAELFKSTADVKLVEVPYRGGGPAVTAVVSGEVPVYFAPIATVLPLADIEKWRKIVREKGLTAA